MASTITWMWFLLLTGSCGFICSAEDTVTYTDAGVMLERRLAEGEHRLVKREITQDMTGFNQEERMVILRRHNDLRSIPPASDMMYLEWDDRLAETAQKWAEQCNFRHSDNRKDLAGFNYVGENLYAASHKFDPASVVQTWYDEVELYTYKTRRCTGVCGHYTQVVWANTRAVGCGVKYCPVLKSSRRMNSGYHVACHYGEGGNYVGERPYHQGESCSKCPITTGYCIKGLCSKRPKIGFNVGDVAQRNILVITVSVTASILMSLLPR